MHSHVLAALQTNGYHEMTDQFLASDSKVAESVDVIAVSTTSRKLYNLERISPVGSGSGCTHGGSIWNILPISRCKSV